ncbi:NAD(P)-binding protein [Phanerochaete sordida]|uniref:NAD(P)-binding protein n=1 Tax=Phanerochaete sordida TaxID=48140 RepID=A0A9P3GQ05_9APHY|nr:NAD(P)-binding protein [Phanerochaete sordida]
MTGDEACGHGRLQDKVCIVTGAGSPRGIGWATTMRFAEEGARHIYAADIDTENFKALQETFEKTYKNSRVSLVEADVADEDAVKRLCDRALAETGRLDVFFANAGTFDAKAASSDQISSTAFFDTLRVNAGSAFLALKYASPAIAQINESAGKVKASGSIIMTGSIGGLRGSRYPMAYCASKAAIHNLAMTGAYENTARGTGVRVNAVAPGAVDTDVMLAELKPLIKERPDVFCGPTEIANTVVFLASDESVFMNGQVVTVDNGLTNGLFVDKVLA